MVGPRIERRGIVSADVLDPKSVETPDTETFRHTLEGGMFSELERRGKFLTAVLDDGHRMVMHMRMTGCLVVAPPERPREPHTRIVITMDDGNELRFSDTRRFGRFWLFASGDVDTSGVSELGLEPWDPGFCSDYLESRIGSSGRTVKECLLDQRVVAGLGNIYSDEVLFDCGIDPSCPARLLCRDDWESLARDIPEKLAFFVEANQSPYEDYLENGGRGYRSTPYLRVYGHGGQPCPVCGRILEKTTVGGRGSVHCPGCQPSRT